MDSGWSKSRDSLKEGTLSAKCEVSYQEELLSLIRIRDFISLLLSYPVKLEEEGILNAWINAFPKWKSQLLSTNDHTVIDIPWGVLTEKAFTCMEGLLPMGKIGQIECGAGSVCNYNNDKIPEAILNLSIDLTVEQLIQALFSADDGYAHNICHVRLTSRNLVEKRTVINKIVAALEDRRNDFGIDKEFLRALWIDSSKYEGDAEVRIQEEISMVMAGVVTEDDDLLCIEEEMANNRYLVIVVDGDKKVDLGKVCFPAGVVVLITTEPSSKSQTEDFTNTCTIALNIRTQDHLLPWEVFCSYAGISMVFSSRAIQRIAVKIVEECRGHLLAIVLVAKSLKNVEDVKQWELALAKLSYINPSFDYQETDGIGNSRVMVNAFVNIIWEGINETQRYCLEVSLFVHKIKKGVPDKILMSNWVSALLMSTQEGPQRSYELMKSVFAGNAADNIRELLDRSVLLQCESGTENVYLPIETYDIIKSLHALNPSIIRHNKLGLTEPPYIGRWHGLVRIELMDNKISELPESPICPKLKVLLLQGNADLIDIPDSFFDCMPLLQYLDLSYTSIRDLPASISKLLQLEVFHLRGCDLFMELPPNIGQLKKLLDLDLDGTLISHLPKEIGELINLRSLTLCFDRYHHLLGHSKKGKQISSSTIIPPELISNLTQLKYLSINVHPEDDRWNKNVAHILVEISGLWRLEAVSMHVPEAKLLEFIPARKTLNFRLVVGNYMHRFISRVTPEVEQKFKSCECSIKFVNGVDVPNQVKRNLGRFKALYLDRHMTIKSLADFELMNLHNLRECILAECNEMETIVDGSYSHDGTALACLESLTVFYMKNLRSICERPSQFLSSIFLCSLKSMALHTCPLLTTIFSISFLENLSLLEELIIEDCPKVTTLISHDSSKHETNIFLPRLRKIWLLYLPELINIFNGLHVGQSLQEMGFYYCPKLQSLMKTELSSEGLRVIKGESRWWETLKWNEAEWGDIGRPNFLNLIFSPIDVEADLMAQLAADHGVDEDQLYDTLLMRTDVGEEGETLQNPRSFKVHSKMCIELMKLVDRISRIFPAIEDAPPKRSPGIESLVLLNNAIDKAKLLLQYCSKCSKLYLAVTGNSVLSRCQKATRSLEKSLIQIREMVPVMLAVEVSRIIDDLECTKFVLDPDEEEAGRVVTELLTLTSDSVEDSEFQALRFAASRLNITTRKAILIEQRSIKNLLDKIGPNDLTKKKILRYLLHLLKKHRNLMVGEHVENVYSRSEEQVTTQNSSHDDSLRSNHFELDQSLNYGQYRTQTNELGGVAPPEEYKCPI